MDEFSQNFLKEHQIKLLEKREACQDKLLEKLLENKTLVQFPEKFVEEFFETPKISFLQIKYFMFEYSPFRGSVDQSQCFKLGQ